MAHTFIIPSIDGPYYYVNVNSLLQSGTLTYPDPPLIFYLQAIFAIATGNTASGVILASAVFAAATSIAIYLLLIYLFNEQLPAVAAGIVSTFAIEHVNLAANLMKNSLGLLFVVGVIFFLQRALDSEKKAKWNIAGAVGLFVLTVLTHILDEGIALLFIAFYLSFSLLFTERKRLLLKYSLIFFVCTAIAVTAFVVLPAYFGDFQKGIVFVSQVSSSTATSTSQSGPNGLRSVGLQDPFICIILAVGVGLSVYEAFRGDRKKLLLLIAATISGILFMLPFLPADFAPRFQNMAFLPASIIVGYSCIRLKRKELVSLAMVVLVLPVVIIGFQGVANLQPTISPEAYADFQKMSTLVNTSNSTILLPATGPLSYWVQYVFNLPTTQNATVSLEGGYTVYVLVDRAHSQSPTGFQAGPAGPNDRPQIQPNQPSPHAGNEAPQNQPNQIDNVNLSNATLVYDGITYSLYLFKS